MSTFRPTYDDAAVGGTAIAGDAREPLGQVMGPVAVGFSVAGAYLCRHLGGGTGPVVGSMKRLVLSSAALLAAPSLALADPPWSAPVTATPITDSGTLVSTPAGHDELVGTMPAGVVGSTTLVIPIAAAGRPGARNPIALSHPRAASFGSDGLVLVGPQTASSIAQARTPALAIAVGKPGAIGKPRAIPGTRGQQVYSVAGSPAGLVAFVTGTVTGRRTRVVWERRGGVLERVLTIKVGARARGAAVAIGSHGDLLVAWEDNHAIFARHIGPGGKRQPVHKLGASVQSAIEVRYDPSGRQEVAWMSQRVDEGDAVSPAVTYYTSATKGHAFPTATVVGRSDITGTGRYISAPGVRLVGSGSDSSVLAFTVYDGTNYRTVAGNVAAGQTLGMRPVSPPGVDAVLGDLAYARSGGTLVLWRSGTRGADASGEQRVFASWRPAGLADFGAPEVVSAPGVVNPPSASVDPSTGKPLAAFGYLAPSIVQVSARDLP